MIHGYRYAPGMAGADPHPQILSAEGVPQRGMLSWPRHLGLRGGGSGLYISFGWQVCGMLWAARGHAARAGIFAACCRGEVAKGHGHRSQSGARVCLAAMPALAEGDL